MGNPLFDIFSHLCFKKGGLVPLIPPLAAPVSSFLKSTFSLNTISLFEENASVAAYHNMSRIDCFKCLNPNRI